MGLAASADQSIDAILLRALGRALARGAGHAGDLTPAEAATLLRAGAITLIDVRTEPEWVFVGRVAGSRRIEWPSPDGSTTPDAVARRGFAARLADVAQRSDRPLALLCRSGVRSDSAAQAAALADLDVYNVLEGFEGHLDRSGRRGTINGWRHAGLPWVQGRETGA